MIQQVHIQNFKCLRDVTVELEPFTVLIGPNDSGKSSFLQALQLLTKALSSDGPEFTATPDMVNLTWRCEGGAFAIEATAMGRDELRYRLSVDPFRRLAEDSLKRERKSVFDKECKRPGKEPSFLNYGEGAGESLRSTDDDADHNTPGWRKARTRIGVVDPLIRLVGETLLASTPYRLQPEQLRNQSPPSENPVLAPNGGNLADVLHSLINGSDSRLRLRLEEELHREIPTLASVYTPVTQTGSERLLRLEFVLSGDEKQRPHVPSEQVSDGALLITAFLSLAYSNTPGILLIEEPENGLHPSRLESVIGLLRKITTGEVGIRPRQVILTTHSPLLLNFVEPSEVRVFQRNEAGETSVTPMDQVPDIKQLSKTFSTGEVWHLFGEKKMFEGASA